MDLVLYGMLPPDLNVGEAWVNPASWIQLLGFSLLLAGTIIYAQVRLPEHMRTTISVNHSRRMSLLLLLEEHYQESSSASCRLRHTLLWRVLVHSGRMYFR